MKSISIKLKLILLVIGIALILLTITGTIFYEFAGIKAISKIDNQVKQLIRMELQLRKFEKDFLIAKLSQGACSENKPEENIRLFSNKYVEIESLIEQMKSNPLVSEIAIEDMLHDVSGKITNYHRLALKFTNANSGNKPIDDLSLTEITREAQSIETGLDQMLQATGNKSIEKAEALIKKVVLLIVIALLTMVVIATLLIQSINKSLKAAQNSIQKISEGDLEYVIDYKSNDEIGVIISYLKAMQSKLRAIIVEIKESAQNMTISSQTLSSGASEQAASAEEVSSSMEEMMATIQQNSQNAGQTEAIALKASHEIARGFENVSKTVRSMQDIADKISIIEEIAEKTDLLAINAAIEAARAGEHGKGFAVVAMEVRKLAERSQKAAAEINQVSKNSVSVAEATGKSMEAIVPEIEKTTQLVQEISAASKEQNDGANQVNSAIQELNQVNQRTAANAEELASQAEVLQDITSFFRINGKAVNKNSKKIAHPHTETNNGVILEFKENVISKPY